MANKFKFKVTVTVDPNTQYFRAGRVRKAEVSQFIRESVGGQFPPDYPLFPGNIKVTVKGIK